MNGRLGLRREKTRLARPVQLCHIVLVVLTLCLAAGARSVEAGSWVPVGAPGGNVRALASDPRDADRIYLGTADGILYRSDDGGAVWQPLHPGFPLRGCSLDEIVVDPRGTVLVGYWEVHGKGGGVARSADMGRTFTVLKGIQGESVRALALAPSDPATLAAGTLTGVFLSRDRGQTWTRITPEGHPDLRNVESLAFDPVDPGILYAGTWHLAWKTSDGGANWAPIHRGMIDDSDVMTMTADSRNAGTVYATACSGVYRSADGGAQWDKLRGIPYSSRRTRAFTLGAEDPSLLVAGTTEGLWISANGGRTWACTTSKDLVVNAVLARPDGSILLGTEEAGVLRTSDLGRSWTPSNKGFSERFVYRLLFDAEGRRLIAAVWGAPRFGGVFVSRDVGGTWTRLGIGLDGRQVLSLALLGSTILAGTDEGIFVRAADATSWSRVRVAPGGREARPRVTELIALESGSLVAATPGGVLRSPDGGRTWTTPDLGATDEVYDLAVPRGGGDMVAAATKSGFFLTHDAGETWTKVGAALEVTPHVLAFSPRNENMLFATTSGGLFRSADQGASWRRVDGGLPHSDLRGIAVNPDGRTLYVSDFTWGGVFRSTDAGGSWARMPTDGLASDRVWTLGVDPEAPERLLAAASAGGLHLLVPTNGTTANAAASSRP
jgi:photosystem II stability/assembly factor-like uncharacterized protein